MPSDSRQPADPALAPFLAAPSREAASRALGELLQLAVAPVVRRVLARRLAGFGAAADADLDDLAAGVLFRLQLHLEAVRDGEREPPHRLADYAAMAAHHAAAEHLAALQPERTRLRDRLRYVLRREPSLALWTGAGGEPVCGPAELRERPAAEEGAALEACARRHLALAGTAWGSFPKLIRGLLAELGPVRLEALVETLAALLGVRDAPSRELEAADAAGLVDAARSSVERMESLERLRRLWEEIAQLPPRQRFALLANLRGEAGAVPLEAFLTGRVVLPEELAAALDCPAAELDRLLQELPRDDAWIAGRLEVDRAQVANLRKAARLRLARRLRGILPGLGR